MALPDIKEAEYGDKVAAERAGEALDQATIAGQMQDAETAVPVAEALAPPEQPAPEEAAAPASAARQPLQPRNLMQLVPPELLYRNRSAKPASAKAYDVGTLWQVLASAPDAPASIRAIAKRLMGKE